MDWMDESLISPQLITSKSLFQEIDWCSSMELFPKSVLEINLATTQNYACGSSLLLADAYTLQHPKWLLTGFTIFESQNRNFEFKAKCQCLDLSI